MKRYKSIFSISSNKLVEWALLEENSTPFNSHNGLILYEAVVDVSVELGNLADLLYDNQNLLIHENNSIDIIIDLLNNIFQNHKVKFLYNYRLPIDNFTSLNTFNKKTFEIIVHISDKIAELDGNNFQNFVDDIIHLVGHELIHRKQFLKMNYTNQTNSYTFNNKKKYLSNKQEIMAYAWQIINSFRLHGALDTDIKKILKTNSNIKFQLGEKPLQDYHDCFTFNDNELKRLYKYMYEYLEV